MKLKLGDKATIIYSNDHTEKNFGVIEITLDHFYFQSDVYNCEIKIEDNDFIEIGEEKYIVYETIEANERYKYPVIGITDIKPSLMLSKSELNMK